MGFVSCYVATAILFLLSFSTNAPLLSSLVFAFAIIPSADLMIGAQKHFPKDGEWRFLAFMWLPVQAALLMWGLSIASSLPWRDVLAWSVPFGVAAGGFGITIAHEVGHRYDRLSQVVSKGLLSMMCYTHFTIEHNLGHHLNVATPEDPATARRNETLWGFILRTVPMQYIHAWRIENKRLFRIGKSPFSLSNRMYQHTFFSMSLPILVLIVLGIKPFVLFLSQAAIAVFLLECINYVEHYGLVRRKIDGKYEKVTSKHSWDANFWLTNHLLFRLQQHGDHHANAAKKFERLGPSPDGPQMPFSYPAMVVLALCPPVWFKIMNPRVEEARKLKNASEA